MTRRIERINDAIQVELGDLIKHHVRDPRLCQLTSVTQVITSADLNHARVFISVMGTDEQKSDTLKCLKAASGYLRKELSQRLTIRLTPELIFEPDDSIERGVHLIGMIQQLSLEQEPPDEDQS